MKHREAKEFSAWTMLLASKLLSTSMCSFTRHPVLEKKSNEEILMTHRGETGWRHWSLSAAKGYKEAHPQSLHCSQTRGTQENLRVGITSLLWYCRGCWTQHHLDRSRWAAWMGSLPLSFCREQTGLEDLRVLPFMLLSVTNPDEYQWTPRVSVKFSECPLQYG